ncbi:aminotransferase class V-fold PLP-dependent enzyme [Saccharospirillum sp. MSK14-1]|uniref:aminotransferase class V-fold PLP-dependent enzyme n=1 Tax=Saccharospirillum sp. MSK14-1 TaxID=1897632 RepID=UPI001E3D4DAE|nr:aminotransferase class V-fold PLP-dependent enzyme [Saccharospirillum sp. MSK14-1]
MTTEMNASRDWQDQARSLQRYYQKFRVDERILLTGHSHQAWPDVAFEGQMQAIEDAAEHIDDKWSAAFAKADQLRAGYARLLDDPSGEYTLGQNTQELLVRWLSALPLQDKPKLITTDGEFHSMRRLLDRLSETQIEVVKVAAEPVSTLAERLQAEIDSNTAAVMCSAVLFKSGRVVPQLGELAAHCEQADVPLLLDAYHAVNVLPWSLAELGLESAFVVGGGYKYCQFGEGNCFLRVPKNCDWRPLVTGWYAEFATLNQAPGDEVQYGRGRWAFEGSTYDTTSHYRAVSVLDFFAERGLTPAVLYPYYKAQQQHLLTLLHQRDWPSHLRLPDRPLDHIGGFLVLHTPKAADIVQQLKARGVYTDSRGDALRLGPAPYVTAEQLNQAVQILAEVMR